MSDEFAIGEGWDRGEPGMSERLSQTSTEACRPGCPWCRRQQRVGFTSELAVFHVRDLLQRWQAGPGPNPRWINELRDALAEGGST